MKLKCLVRDSKIKQLTNLRPDDPDFSSKFEEIAKDLKEHIRYGHPRSRRIHRGKSCPGK
jgi:hypothetical protein